MSVQLDETRHAVAEIEGVLLRLHRESMKHGQSGMAKALDLVRARLISGVADPLAEQCGGRPPRAKPKVFSGGNGLQHLTDPDTGHDFAFCDARTGITWDTLDAEGKVCGTCAHRAIHYLMAA